MFLFPLAGNSQPETDSLKQLLETALADSARIDILLSLSSSSAQDEALAYGREANQLAEQSGLKGRQALALKNIAVAYYRKGEYIRALEYYKQSIELYRASNDPGGISNILNNIGAIYNAQGDDAKALEYFLEALRYGEEAENELRIGTALLNVGVAYINKPQNYDQGIAALKRAVPAFEKIDYQLGIAVAYSNLGEVFLKKEEPDSALYYLEKSKEIVTDAGDDSWLAFTLNLIGKAYIQAGKYEQAIRTHEKAIQVAERKDSRLELGWATLGLANSYHANGNNALALRTYLKAESIFSEMGVKEGLKDVYKGLADTYESSSDYQDAYRYHQLYSNFKDTLYNVETADKVKNLTLNYELEKKEAEIEQLSIENKLQEAQIQKAQVLRNFFIALAAFILIVAAGIVVQLRITRKSNERKQALDRQTQINQQLQQIDRLKDQFLANTSHELRTPLNGIIGLADSLIDGVAGQLPKKAVDDLGMIASSGKRLAALVNDILDFSKLKDFNIELNRRPADLYALADIVMKINTPLIRGKDLQLLNTVPQELPAVDGDENRLQQILYNLIGNAIKFTESGYIKVDAVEIDGGDTAGGKMIQVSVEDTGIGIPENKLELIFQAFEQGDGSTARSFSGTGLGLSISKRLVELHGGRIWVVSKPGEGSTFFFTLPVSGEKAALPAPSAALSSLSSITVDAVFTEPAVETGVSTAGQDGTIRILMVDDEPINLQVLINHLSDKRYELTQAMNGEEAIRAVADGEKFDLILLDIMMPRMSGYEVCQKIREQYLPSELPIIMVTAKNQVEDLVQGLNLGANDYLAKPFSKAEFQARIKTQLNLHRINVATGKFVPSEFLRSLGRENITDVLLGDHTEQEVTVFFTDIRDYTSLAEQMTPAENFKFVSAFNKRMGPIIRENGGFINQYLGDAIMAIFPGNPADALRAAIQIEETLRIYNQRRIAKKRAALKIGIGMHTGQLIMGVIGDQNRMDAATIADTVNIASRVENLTKYYSASILLTKKSVQSLPNPEAFHLRYLGKVKVKGKAKSTGIYECYDSDPPEILELKVKGQSDFEAGLQHFSEGAFPEAALAFKHVLEENEKDQVARHFYDRSSKLAEEGVPDNWSGVEELFSKW